MCFRALKILNTIILSFVVIFFSIGCEESTTDVPEDNPGEILITQAELISFQVQGQVSPIRSKLNTFWGNSSPNEEIADSLLEKLVSTTSLIWSAGLLDHEGQVLKVFPVTEDSLLGRSWYDIPQVHDALETPSLLTGTVDKNSIDRRSYNYYRSITEVDQPFGVLFCAINADSLISLSTGLAEIDEENQRGLFILEKSSKIIYDRSESYFGQAMNNPQSFSPNAVSLATMMTDPSSANGYLNYDGIDIPGGLIDGHRHIVGWAICPMEGNTFWSIAITEPI